MTRTLHDVLAHRRALRFGGGVAAAGLLLLLLALLVEPRQALAGYLAVHAALLTIALGALFLLLTGMLLRASWLAAWWTSLTALAGTLPLLAMLFAPVALGVAVLYPWVRPIEMMEPVLAQRVRPNEMYLDIPFWLARAALYFAVWIGLARWLGSGAARDGARRRVNRERGDRERMLSALGLIALILTGTFSAYDWLKSLSPYWASGVYGLRLVAGGVSGALAALALLAHVGARAHVPTIITPAAHPRVLGGMLLAAVLVWGYAVIPPWIIVWSANLPVEVTWYLPRVRTSWGILGLVLVVGHLVIPAILLLVGAVRTRIEMLGPIGAWLLAMHLLDSYWLVLPTMRPAGVAVHLGDLSGLLLVPGAVVAWLAWRSGGRSAASRAGPAPSPAGQGAIGS